MSSRQALLLSGQVREVLADQDLERLAGMAAAGFRCTSCGRRGGPADGPASVVIVMRSQPGRADRVAVVGLAHAQCSPPQVVEERDVLGVPSEASMTATAVLLPSPAGPRPLLVTELSAVPVAVTGPGERHEPGRRARCLAWASACSPARGSRLRRQAGGACACPPGPQW